MKPSEMRPTNIATAIAKGLIRSGRARHAERVGDVLRLERKSGGYYWISFDGRQLRQGACLLDAEPLQATFVAAMMVAGRG